MPAIWSEKVPVSGANGFVATSGAFLTLALPSAALSAPPRRAHIASPLRFAANDPAELSDPGVKGFNRRDARMCSQARSDCEDGIVITSSAVARLTAKEEPLGEYDWSDGAIEAVARKGAAAGDFDRYANSKVLVECSAWEFFDKYKSLILGVLSSPAELNTSTQMMSDAFTTEGSKTGGGLWVNVEDVGRAHVLIITTELPPYVPLSIVNKAERTNVNRFILGGYGFAWQDMLDAAPAEATHYRKGQPGSVTSRPRDRDDRHAKEVLGVKFTSIEDTVTGTLTDYEVKGWLKV